MVTDPRQAALDAARRLADACVGCLGTPVKSAILHGSLATGDYLPGASDIDLLIVVENRLSDAEIGAVESVVRAADLGGAAGIDLLVATADVCAAPTREPPVELLVERRPRGSPAFESVAGDASFADLVPELSVARQSGRALRGAEPGDVIGPVPREWVVERARYWLSRWLGLLDDAEDAAFMALTACRMWHFAVEGAHCSKSAAARWAPARDPSLTVVEQALRQRLEDPRQLIDEQGLEALLRTALRESAAPVGN